jgi:6-pyruvoyl-tetrahydropterin synthase
MTQEDADQDWQLGLYHLALLSKWPEAEKTKLVWHFLVFNKQIESWRRREELDKLQETVVQRIQEIERAKDFPPAKSALCDWCAFQDICPLWAHPKKMEALEVNAYLKDPGVKLVARYAELEEEKSLFKEKIKAIEEEQSKVEEAALAFAEKEKIKVIDGPDHQLLVTIKDEFCAPTRNEDQMKWQQLRDLLIQENRYLEVSTVNSMMLNNRLRNWPQEMMAKVKSYLIKRSVRKVDLRRKTR